MWNFFLTILRAIRTGWNDGIAEGTQDGEDLAKRTIGWIRK